MYLLSIYYEPGTILGNGERAVKKSDKVPVLRELAF